MGPVEGLAFDPACRRCTRLAAFRETTHRQYPQYHCAPVAPFGAARAPLLIVGLAPGLHGANATGRPFTGDHAGLLLYATLHKYGFSNAPRSLHGADGLRLTGCRITNAVKCVPPQNKPAGAEVANCNAFLRRELQAGHLRLIIALGTIAHQAVLKARGCRARDYRFAHHACHRLPGGLLLLDCYHCSRYNTQTGRLSEEMFDAVFETACRLLERG